MAVNLTLSSSSAYRASTAPAVLSRNTARPSAQHDDAGARAISRSSTGAALLADGAQDAATLKQWAQPGGLERLQAMTGRSFDKTPDVMALRSGPGTTAAFSGGHTTFSMSDTEGNAVTYFAYGQPLQIRKGAAITYGEQATAQQRAAFLSGAMAWLDDHLADHQSKGGQWNQPLVNARG